MSEAVTSSPTRGLAAPAAIGTSRPASAATRCALIVARSSGQLPATVVIARRSILSSPAARRIATASSWPGSQSMRMGSGIEPSTIWSAPLPVRSRVLILSWEFPPIVEGGLARHVRKLTEQLAAAGHDGHALTRGRDPAPAGGERQGGGVHLAGGPAFPRDDLDAFLAWVAQMNADMLATGAELLERFEFDLLHSHDWLVATAAQRLAARMG